MQKCLCTSNSCIKRQKILHTLAYAGFFWLLCVRIVLEKRTNIPKYALEKRTNYLHNALIYRPDIPEIPLNGQKYNFLLAYLDFL